MREISSKSRLVIALLLMTSAALGQGWTAVSSAPAGYALTPGAGDGESVYTRRFRKIGASHRLRQSILAVADVSASDYLEGAADEGESFVEGSSTKMPVIGRDGRRATFRGTRRLRGDMMNTLRTLTAVRIDDASMLIIESTLAYRGDEPPRLLRTASRKAVVELLKSLEVRKQGPSAKKTAAGTSAEKRQYTNDSIAPFSFEYPSGWYVAHDDVQVPGSLWVVATPEERTAVSGTLEQVQTALRITLVGHVPAMLGATNELNRAVDFVTSGRSARSGQTFTVVSDALLGAARGRLLRIASPEIPQQGFLLVGVAETTVVVAEFIVGGGLTSEMESTALDLLNSIRVDVDRAETGIDAAGPSPSFTLPANWSLESIPVEDGSRAVVMGSGTGTEVVIRSLATGSALDESSLRSVLERIVADDLELTTRERLATAERRHAPMGDVIVHALVAGADGTTDIYGIATANRVHVCFVDVTEGAAGREYGLALRSLLSWSGEDGSLKLEGAVENPITLRHHAVDSFGAGGNARAATAGSLKLAPSGVVRGTLPGPDGATVVSGRFTLEGDRLVLDIGDGRKIAFSRDSGGGWRDDANGRIWHATPDLD